MSDYLQSSDVPLLREHGFTIGCFGESWFRMDEDGAEWQAYVVDGDDRITFVGPDRVSQYMSRSTFVDKFTKE